jgi:acetylornithine deacetylase/succinyl-diaminopimelate desuccinylase-like protein
MLGVQVIRHPADLKSLEWRNDSLLISRIAPVAMLFIRCRNGVSHRPDEYASSEAIATGVTVSARG